MESTRTCAICGIDITDKKATAKTCSPGCRKELSRLESVTPNVTLSDQIVTPSFDFVTETIKRLTDAGTIPADTSTVRHAKYWYDVPLAAKPIIQKGWPKMPEYMNGRQYFLWWKNNFETKNDTPIILNPFPKYDNLTYVRAGENSRRWGA